MLIESKLRTRIITSLSWLIDQSGRWGIDTRLLPQAKDAISLLRELEASPPAPTEQQCRDLALSIGKTEGWGSGYFRQYGCQGWVRGNGVPITDVRMHMVQLRNSGVEYPDAPTDAPKTDVQGLTPRQRHIQKTGR